MKVVNFDYTNVLHYISNDDILAQKDKVLEAHKTLHGRCGAGNEFTGWLDWPEVYDKEEYTKLKATARRISEDSDVLLVVSIGGSYLGSRAVIEILNGPHYNSLANSARKTPAVLFVGNNLCADYLYDTLNSIKNCRISVNVISKSGTTMETALTFRIVRKYMEDRYGKKEAAKRIYVTTDKNRGRLKEIAEAMDYEMFSVPENIGGRYSVLSSVGLLPIAVAGGNIDELMHGALDAMHEYSNPDINENVCYKYAAIRNVLYSRGKAIEVLSNFDCGLHYLGEWWKQLFGESEGKEKKGIFPAGIDLTTDLHSLGQYMQDGTPNIFETIVLFNNVRQKMFVNGEPDDADELNFLTGSDMNEINKRACQGTIIAHTDAGVPNMLITLAEKNEYSIGYLIYFFEKACGISAYMLGVNPFNQPGVEEYKKNMLALLGKPGCEQKREELAARINEYNINIPGGIK